MGGLVSSPTVHFYGDSCLLIVVDGAADEVWVKTHVIAAAINETIEPDTPLRTVLAGYDSVFIEFDPLRIEPSALHDRVAALAASVSVSAAGLVARPARRIIVPVLYDDDAGPDLLHVANTLDCSPADVVAAHTANRLTVRMVASPVGSPMMDITQGLSGMPRRSSPRARLEAGSVAIAADQCMIYAGASPGGWNIIGQTPCRLYDLDQRRPPVCRPGDVIEFQSVDRAEFDALCYTFPVVIDELP